MRRRSVVLAVVAAIVVLAAVGTAIALVDGGPQRYETDEFSFAYPGEWQPIEGIDLPVAELAGVRVQNRYGNYLDEFGDVASPQNAHGITLRAK